ncbi:MAG: nucleotidyl transferase AbiEii/AbiGii toxin family protein [Planctomycetia bacterium]|nr:nucleotidyl transferase AbiEii/AbiGii toxin family protein [Planctomycetia bacterium]
MKEKLQTQLQTRYRDNAVAKKGASIEAIRRRAILAMFSDDELFDRLVLKGGNLLAIVYGVSDRASVDIDFSVDGTLEDVADLKERVERVLQSSFREIGLEAFDVKLLRVPEEITDNLRDFWGGYQIDFKVIERERFEDLKDDVDRLRRSALAVGKQGSTKFRIEVSNFEYCKPKERRLLDHLTIYAYTPVMVVCEKLRAICQQMPEYRALVHSHERPRAHDFVDIHTLSKKFTIDFQDVTLRDTLRKTFEAKRVPLALLAGIAEHREFHRQGFQAVRDAFPASVEVREFDFYFYFVLACIDRLEAFWDK